MKPANENTLSREGMLHVASLLIIDFWLDINWGIRGYLCSNTRVVVAGSSLHCDIYPGR